jgi:hypothetical protein
MGQLNVTVMNDNATQSIPTFIGIDPTWTGVYFHALVDVPGVAASNNYLSVLNPSGSGKIAIALGFICGSYSVNTVTAPAAMAAFRISAHSAGTDVTAATVNRFATAFPNPVSQVKTGNPTITTTSSAMIGIPPTVGTNAQNGQTVSPTPGASFVFLPGEGIAFQTATSDTDIRWQMQYIWAEKSL